MIGDLVSFTVADGAEFPPYLLGFLIPTDLLAQISIFRPDRAPKLLLNLETFRNDGKNNPAFSRTAGDGVY